MSKDNALMGSLMETVFKTILDTRGFKEGKDYIRGGKSEPDYFFPAANTYIEIKFTSNADAQFSEKQKAKFLELKNKGFDVKSIVFSAKLFDVFPKNLSGINVFIDKLKQKNEVKK